MHVCASPEFEGKAAESLKNETRRYLLNELMAQTQNRDMAYWRDQRGHEVDFVLARPRTKPLAIECKWSADNFDPAKLRAFRQQHPEGENFVIAQDVERAFSRNYQDLRVRFAGLNAFIGVVPFMTREMSSYVAFPTRLLPSRNGWSRTREQAAPAAVGRNQKQILRFAALRSPETRRITRFH